MPNKHNKHKREDWISIVITIAFILGFLLIANEPAITGLTAIGENITENITEPKLVATQIPLTFGIEGPSPKLWEDCADISEWMVTTNWAAAAGTCTDTTAGDGDLISDTIDLTNVEWANFSFVFTTIPATHDGNEGLYVYVNSSAEGWQTLNHYIDGASGTRVEFNITKNITMTTGVHVRFLCDSNKADETCEVDNINLTSYAPPLDETAPTVTLVWPSNTTNSTIRFINFTYNATDANTVDDCILWLSKSPGVWELNKTDTGIEEEVNQSFNITVDDQSMLWKVECNDTVTNNRGNSSIFNITVDATPPIVNITWPKNNTNWTTSEINFTYNTSEGFMVVDSCVLWLKKSGTWELNFTDPSIAEVINQSINITVDDQNMLWLIECNDTWNNRGNSTIYNITVDTTPPFTNLQAPVNTTNSTTKYINFTYNATNGGSSIDTCILWLNKGGTWELNKTNTTIAEEINQTFNITVDDQGMRWRIECNDTLNNRGNSTTYNISIDNQDPPVLNISSPNNNSYSLSHSVNFTYNVTDTDKFGKSGDVINCTLLLQKGGSWIYNQSNESAIQEGINQTINITLEHTNINWTVECIDALGAKANATGGYFNYTVFDAIPIVTEVFPKNNTWQVNHSVSFTYNVTSLDTVTSCSLWLQKGTWGLNKTDTDIEKNVNQTFNITLEHENVNWTVSCNNTFNEPANLSIMNFTVYDATPVVTLVWPSNNTYQTSHKSVNFTYNVTSKDSAITCDLYINDIWNSTDATGAIERYVNQTFNLTFDDYQNIDWSVGCNNSFNEYVNSTTYNYSMFEVQNQPPKIPAENITQPGDQSINLDSYKIISYTFVACDEEATKDNLVAHGNFTGEASFFDSNITCEATGWTNTTCKQFNCSVNIWYFYKAGSWNASMNVTDGTYYTHSNISTFTLGTTTGMTMSPTTISWSTLYLGQWNKTTVDDPIIINNTGNYNVTVGSVNITGYDLKGEETLTEYIPAINFTVNIETGASNPECMNTTSKGVGILNQTSVDILGSMLPRGNHTINDGTAQEQLYFCLRQVPYSLSEQSYSTENSQQWIIGVS